MSLSNGTPRTARLEDARLETFRRDGYLVLPGLFCAGDMLAVSRWTDEIVSWPEVPGRHMVYYEDSVTNPGTRVLSRIENFCPYHKQFDGLLRGEAVLGRVSELFGESAVLFKDKINFKMPGGGGFEAHQDVQAGWSDYAGLHITMLLSIDEATIENGCLEMAPGLHTRGLLGETWKPLEDDGIDYLPCPTRPGDAIFFDSFVPHRSGPNTGRCGRRVLYVTYNRASEGDHRARYYADKRRSFPPDCEREAGRKYEFRV